jgi:hypothetical protein
MKYGQIAGNSSINRDIYLCFKHISEEDEKHFVKKFKEQPQDSDDIIHTFNELILGAYLSSKGFRVRYEYPIENKTPDWCILNNKAELVGIVELVNFHVDANTQSDIAKQIQSQGGAAYWPNINKNNGRLYQSIWDEMGKHKDLTNKLNIPYIVSIHSDIFSPTDFKSVRVCLSSTDFGLFQQYPHVSGVLYFNGSHFFEYEKNPNALRDLLGGDFSLKTNIKK